MDLWFTSDWHLGHENIIKYSGRPFANAREMDEALLTWHNELVKPSDHVYNLGDLTMLRGGRVQQEIFTTKMRQFHGHKRLLLGNHDHFPIEVYLRAGFEKIYATWRGIDNILLSHIPIHSGSIGSAVANVHGHTHTHPNEPPILGVTKDGKVLVKPYVNICVEVTNYRPISLDEVKQRIRLATEVA